MSIGNLEHATGNVESSPGCGFNCAAAQIDDGIAAADTESKVGVTRTVVELPTNERRDRAA